MPSDSLRRFPARWVCALLLPTGACLLPLAASATETFEAVIDVGVGGIPPPGCVIPPAYSGTDPVTQGASCGDLTSVGAAFATAQHGRVGASTSATDVTQPILSSSIAAWQDDQVLITAAGNPNLRGTTTASLNFQFDGRFGGFGAPTSLTGVGLTIEINFADFSVALNHSDHGNSCQNISAIDFCTPFNNSVGLPAVVTTPTLTLPVGTPFELAFSIVMTSSTIGPGASTDGDFAHTFGLTSSKPVLNFTDPGFTVNAGNYIVDNGYVAPVDEPATLMLLYAGLGSLLLLGKRRFGRAVASILWHEVVGRTPKAATRSNRQSA